VDHQGGSSKWKSYPLDDATWEPKNALKNAQHFIRIRIKPHQTYQAHQVVLFLFYFSSVFFFRGKDAIVLLSHTPSTIKSLVLVVFKKATFHLRIPPS
jgi:hypothetical protein